MRKSLSQARWRRRILSNRLLSDGPHLPKMAMLDVWLTFPIIIKKSGISTSLMKGIVAGLNTTIVYPKPTFGVSQACFSIDSRQRRIEDMV